MNVVSRFQKANSCFRFKKHLLGPKDPSTNVNVVSRFQKANSCFRFKKRFMNPKNGDGNSRFYALKIFFPFRFKKHLLGSERPFREHIIIFLSQVQIYISESKNELFIVKWHCIISRGFVLNFGTIKHLFSMKTPCSNYFIEWKLHHRLCRE